MKPDYAKLHYEIVAKTDWNKGHLPIPDIHGDGEWHCVLNKPGVMIVFVERMPQVLNFYNDATWHRVNYGVIVEIASIMATGNTTIMFHGDQIPVVPVNRAIESALAAGTFNNAKEDEE